MMRMQTKCLAALCTAAAMTAAVCVGCGTTNTAGSGSGSAAGAQSGEIPSAQQDVFAMDAYMSLTAYGANAQKAIDASVEEINRLDALFSVSVEDSEIALANEGNTVLVSSETEELIQSALDIEKSTDEAFTITMYPLTSAWGFPTQKYHVLSEAKREKLLKHVGGDKVHLDTETDTMSLDKGTKIDLGGIAKGYLGNRLRDIMKEQGVDSAMISLGGSTVELIGSKTDGQPWRIGIMDPDDNEKTIGAVAVTDCVVDTSGGYQRFFKRDGKTYWHILDPATGAPARSGLSSVTIVGEDGTTGDALSTALFVMGHDKALEYWRAHSDEFQAVLVEEDGSITITEGLEDCFESREKFEVAHSEET